jgi:hypothetical protein
VLQEGQIVEVLTFWSSLGDTLDLSLAVCDLESFTDDGFGQGDAAPVGIAQENECTLEESSHHDEVKLSDRSRSCE